MIMTDLAIDITKLNKIYDAKGKGKAEGSRKHALIDVDLQIKRGAFYGLLGPNGAGKSTLINIMAGLVNKSSGKVIIDGVDQDVDARETRKRIGVVPQEVMLDPFFPIEEMLDYHAGYYGIPHAKRRTQELLNALHLADKAKLNSRRLSGGMKRRVLIAKAMVHSPPIIVLDEPTAGVDVELRTQLWEYVRELNASGITILLTTHYLEEAEELCDHISIINHGRVIANDSKDNLMLTMNQKRMMFRVDDPITQMPESLKPYDAEQLDETSFALQYSPEDTSIEELLHLVKEAGFSIKDLSTEEPDLEEVFKELVSEKKAA